MVYRRNIPHQSDFSKNQIFIQSEKNKCSKSKALLSPLLYVHHSIELGLLSWKKNPPKPVRFDYY